MHPITAHLTAEFIYGEVRLTVVTTCINQASFLPVSALILGDIDCEHGYS